MIVVGEPAKRLGLCHVSLIGLGLLSSIFQVDVSVGYCFE